MNKICICYKNDDCNLKRSWNKIFGWYSGIIGKTTCPKEFLTKKFKYNLYLKTDLDYFYS